MIKEETRRFLLALRVPFYMTLVIWAVHIFKVTSGNRLSNYGVFPRSWDGVQGILFSPLIHGDFAHLIHNTAPLFVLTLILFYFYKRAAAVAFVGIYLLTGLVVWLFARPVYHIGASGVVYGLVSFIFWSGVFRRNTKTIVLALIVLFFYGSMFAGIVPNEEGISWESHLMGGIVGIIMAFVLKSAIEKDEEPRPDPWADEALELPQYYFDRDVFERKKWERNLPPDQDFEL